MGIAERALLAVVMGEMVHHERADGIGELERRADTLQKGGREGTAGRLVTRADPAQCAAAFRP